MRFKKLDMSNEIDKNILLTYFFKKLNTKINKNELLSMSSIFYDSEQRKLQAHTRRFQEKLEPYKNINIEKEDVIETLKKALDDELRIEEEIVQCSLHLENSIDYFYITVIGVDFFLTESSLRK